jgi:hypothetical protein
MPKPKKRDVKDSARKRTLSPPHATLKPESEERDRTKRQMQRQVGQYTGAGTPPLVKK